MSENIIFSITNFLLFLPLQIWKNFYLIVTINLYNTSGGVFIYGPLQCDLLILLLRRQALLKKSHTVPSTA